MIGVPDVAATLDWYASIGFTEIERHEDDGLVDFGMVSFGKAESMLRPGGRPPGPWDVSLQLIDFVGIEPYSRSERIYSVFHTATGRRFMTIPESGTPGRKS